MHDIWITFKVPSKYTHGIVSYQDDAILCREVKEVLLCGLGESVTRKCRVSALCNYCLRA